MKKIALFLAVVLLLAGCAAPAATERSTAAVELPTLSSGDKEDTPSSTHGKEDSPPVPTREQLDPDDPSHSLPSQTEPEFSAQDAVLMIAEATGTSGKKTNLGEAQQFRLPVKNVSFSFASGGTLVFSAASSGESIVNITLHTENCFIRNRRLSQTADEIKLLVGETVYLAVKQNGTETVCALWLEDGK